MSENGTQAEPGAARADGFDRVLAEIRIVEEIERIKEMRSILNAGNDVDEVELAARELDETTRERLAEVLRFLQSARRAMVCQPAAAAYVFRALVAEGERVAATPDGRRRAIALAANPVMNDLRRVWEATSLNMLGDAAVDASAIPAGWVDLILDAVIAGGTDQLVDGLGGTR